MSGIGVVLVCLCVCPLIKEMKNYSSEIYVTNWCEYVVIIWSPVLEVIRFLVHLTRELFFLFLDRKLADNLKILMQFHVVCMIVGYKVE